LPRARLRGALGVLVPRARRARLRVAAEAAPRAAPAHRPHLEARGPHLKVGQCPSCGAPIDFAAGAARVKVCEHCHTVVLRGDPGKALASAGKVAELTDTESVLKVRLQGSSSGTGLRVVGRIQLAHG